MIITLTKKEILELAKKFKTNKDSNTQYISTDIEILGVDGFFSDKEKDDLIKQLQEQKRY